MKKNKLTAFLQAWIFAFAVSFSGAAGLAGGMRMTAVRLPLLALLCCGISLAAAAAFSFRRGGRVLLGVSAVAILLLRDWIVPSLGAVLRRMTTTYSTAYGWPVLEIGGDAAIGAPMEAGLLLLVIPGIYLICRGVIRQKRLLPYIAAGFLPLALSVVVTDTVPPVGNLMLLLGSQCLLILTGLVRRQSEESGRRLTAMLLVPVVLATAMLFWLHPKENFEARNGDLPRWIVEFPVLGELFSGVGGGGSYTGETVHLSTLGRKWETRQVVMTVRSTGTETLYLRGCAYDRYDGSSWEVTDQQKTKDRLWPSAGENQGTVTVRTESDLPILYFPYYARGGLWTDKMPTGAIANGDKTKTYEFFQYRPANNSISDSAERKEYNRLNLVYKAVPSQYVNALLEYLQDNGFDPSDPAESIARIVRSCAEYSTNPDRMPMGEKDFALWFLQEAESGYCVHFATAATVLLRAAGIPARYVTGYMVQVQANSSKEVYVKDAHAWVEYYESGYGWKMLEVTPGFDGSGTPDRPQPSTTPDQGTEAPTVPDQSGNTTAPVTPEDTTGSKQEDPTQSTSGQGGGAGSAGGEAHPIFFWVLGIFAAAGLLYLQYFLRLRRKRGRMYTGEENRQAICRWRYARRLAWLLKEELPEELTELAEKAKFSQHTLTAEELEQFQTYLESAENRLKKTNILRRIVCKVIFAI